eukprot:661495-Pyramimonas_sp.AAC.1
MAPTGDHPGGHRLIDYCLVASSIKHMVKLEWDLEGPWASPHVGIKGTLKVGGQKLMKRIMEQPMECQLAFGPDRPWQHHLEVVQQRIDKGMRHGSPKQRKPGDVDHVYM